MFLCYMISVPLLHDNWCEVLKCMKQGFCSLVLSLHRSSGNCSTGAMCYCYCSLEAAAPLLLYPHHSQMGPFISFHTTISILSYITRGCSTIIIPSPLPGGSIHFLPYHPPSTAVPDWIFEIFTSFQAKVMFSSASERIWMKVFCEDGQSIMDIWMENIFNLKVFFYKCENAIICIIFQGHW